MKNSVVAKGAAIKGQLVLLGWLLLFVPGILSAQFEEDDNRVLNQFIVMLKPGHKIEQALAEPGIAGQAVNKECLSVRMGIYLLERSTTILPEEFLLVLKRNPHIKLAQFNHRIKDRSIPNDTDFGLQWGLLNTGQSSGIPGADIDATQAWDIDTNNVTVDGDTIVVAIIDKRFDMNHEDINYFVNRNEVAGNGIDDDANGYIDDVSGWNVFDDNGNVAWASSPITDHATHCAGIAGAITNNSKGIAGVCRGVKILPIFGSSFTEAYVIKSYDYIIAMRSLYNNTFKSKGAFVVATNSSFGVDDAGPADYPIWCAMYDTMGYEGILSAAATNNTILNVDVEGDMPTTCPSNYMIGVTSTSMTEVKNGAFGKVNIDLGAPGFNVYSTVYPNSYKYNSGTSMAAPHVAGTIAAMYAAACQGLIDKYHEQPDSVALLMKDYLLQAAEWTSPLNNLTVSNGRLNLYRAVMNVKQYNCDSCSFSIGIDKEAITCKGVNDGALAVNSDSLNLADANILWSNGLTETNVQNLEPGFYTVTVIDTATGCSRLATAELHYPDTLKLNSVAINPPVNGNTGSITAIANAANDPLSYSIDGVNWQPTATFSIPADGTYTIYVKNPSGCIVQQTVVVSNVDDVLAASMQLAVYPNPAEDMVTVSCPLFAEAKTTLDVFDIAGRKIFEAIPAATNYRLSTAQWNTGLYFLRVNGVDRKLVIAR
ncbi:MAG TPA: S8/S53 family peptidase [Chitinophagales bacterium]|nr:S8/S53 family peptidase [Chitinophagales bacterium]